MQAGGLIATEEDDTGLTIDLYFDILILEYHITGIWSKRE